MAKIDTTTLKGYCDAYGVAVRAGLITPNPVDEAFIRRMFGLPDMSEEVRRAWQETGGVRTPITLVPEQSQSETNEAQEADA
jgi:hypothetical protein